MPLVLAVGGVGDALGEGVVGVVERPHERRVRADVQRLQAVPVLRRVHHRLERGVVGELRFAPAEHSAHRLSHNPLRIRRIVRQHRDAPVELRVELLAEAIRRRLLQKRPLGELLVGERLLAHVLEKRRVDFLHPRDHLGHDL